MWQSILSLFCCQTPKTLQRACVIRRSLLPGELGSGVSRGAPPPLYFFSNHPFPPPLSQGLDDRAPLIWRSGSATALNRLYQSLKGKNIIIMHACLSLPRKRTYTMLARVQQSYETRSYDFKIKYWDDFDTRLEWLRNSSKHSNVTTRLISESVAWVLSLKADLSLQISLKNTSIL